MKTKAKPFLCAAIAVMAIMLVTGASAQQALPDQPQQTHYKAYRLESLPPSLHPVGPPGDVPPTAPNAIAVPEPTTAALVTMAGIGALIIFLRQALAAR